MKTIVLILGLVSFSAFSKSVCQIERLELIFRENISSELNCLQDTALSAFDIVSNGTASSVNIEGIEQYLRQLPVNETDERVIEFVRGVSDLTHLIQGDKHGVLVRTSIVQAFELLLKLNNRSASVYRLFENESPITYSLHMYHRELAYTSVQEFLLTLRSTFSLKTGDRKVDLPLLINRLTAGSNAVKSMKLKKIFAGGEDDVLTHGELHRLIIRGSNIALVLLDQIRFPYIIMDEVSAKKFQDRMEKDYQDLIFKE